MIVDRREVLPNMGRRRDAVAVLKEIFELWERRLGPVTYRIYSPEVAPFGIVAWETEFENLAEWTRLGHELFALPEMAPLLERWQEAMQAGGTHTIWELE